MIEMKTKTAGFIALAIMSLTFLCPIASAADQDPQLISTPPEDTRKTTEARGTIESLEGRMTVWMYGTHTLVDSNGEVMFALKSDSVDLDTYTGEEVYVAGTKVHDGVDTGPPLLNVEKVTEASERQTGGMNSRYATTGLGIFTVIVAAAAIYLARKG